VVEDFEKRTPVVEVFSMARYSREIADYLKKLFGEPLVGAEIGAGIGGTTNVLLHTFPKLFLYAVDPWDTGESENTTAITVPEKQLKSMHDLFLARTEWAKDRLSVLAMKSKDASIWVCEEELDFVFVDGDHRYEAVLNDLYDWWSRIRSGGVLIGHDYRHDRAGLFGVIAAVTEFCNDFRLQLEMINRNTYAIRKE
jgi:hypothetical protein